MARLPTSPFSPTTTSAIPRKDSLLDLNRLLARLDQTILHASAEQERRLRRDEFERTKVRYNIETARATLTRLEQDALTTKIHSKRQELQADLNRKRELIDQLFERVKDLEEIGSHEDEDDSSDGEDILAEIIPTPSESMDSRSTDVFAGETTPGEEDSGEGGDSPTRHLSSMKGARPEPEADETHMSEKPWTTTSQTIRSRGKHSEVEPEPEKDTAQTTSAKLFGDKTDTALATTATEEAILDSQRKEQEALSEDILRLAKALKTNSLHTSRLLEDDKDVLGQVGEGLNTTDQGMESAGRKMSALSKMTEGKGWWGRMILFAMVYGMMVVLVLLFAVMPKLRF